MEIHFLIVCKRTVSISIRKKLKGHDVRQRTRPNSGFCPQKGPIQFIRTKNRIQKGFNVWVSLEVTLLISVETDSRVLEKKMDRAVTLAQDLIITRDIPVTGRLPKEGPIPQDPSKNVYPATNRNMFHCAANMFHCAEIET